MKRYAIAATFIAAALVVGLAGCAQSRGEGATALARVSDDGLVVLADQATLAGFFDERPLGVLDTATPTYTVRFDEYAVEGEGEHLYLVGRGTTSEGESYIEALSLEVLADGMVRLARE